MFMYIST
jgi:hypothetical protein